MARFLRSLNRCQASYLIYKEKAIRFHFKTVICGHCLQDRITWSHLQTLFNKLFIWRKHHRRFYQHTRLLRPCFWEMQATYRRQFSYPTTTSKFQLFYITCNNDIDHPELCSLCSSFSTDSSTKEYTHTLLTNHLGGDNTDVKSAKQISYIVNIHVYK